MLDFAGCPGELHHILWVLTTQFRGFCAAFLQHFVTGHWTTTHNLGCLGKIKGRNHSWHFRLQLLIRNDNEWIKYNSGKKWGKAREKQRLMTAMTTSYTFCSNQRQAIACDCTLKTKLYFSLQPLPIPWVCISHDFFIFWEPSQMSCRRLEVTEHFPLLAPVRQKPQSLLVPSRGQSQALHNLPHFSGCFDLQPLIPTSLMIQHHHPSKPHEFHLLNLHSQQNRVNTGGWKISGQLTLKWWEDLWGFGALSFELRGEAKADVDLSARSLPPIDLLCPCPSPSLSQQQQAQAVVNYFPQNLTNFILIQPDLHSKTGKRKAAKLRRGGVGKGGAGSWSVFRKRSKRKLGCPWIPSTSSIPLLIFSSPLNFRLTGFLGSVEQKEWAQHSIGTHAEAVGNYTKDVFGTHSHHPWRAWSEMLANGTGKDLKGEISL